MFRIAKKAIEKTGLNNRMNAAKLYNKFRYRKYYNFRNRQYESNRILSKGNLQNMQISKEGGWAVDETKLLPHLDALVAESHLILQQDRPTSNRNKNFMINQLCDDDLRSYRSFLDFATSERLASIVSGYLQCVPVLSSIKLLVSKEDSSQNNVSSQLYHLDHADSPLMKVIVHLSDITEESGPFTFLPANVSAPAKLALGYGKMGGNYRVTDSDMYNVANREEQVNACYPQGTVLFIDTSRCFHYGSRSRVKARHLVMYQYVSACRTDFRRRTYQEFIGAGDTELRKMLLDDRYINS